MADEQKRTPFVRGYSDRALARDGDIEDRVLAEISGDHSRHGRDRADHPSLWGGERDRYTPNPRGDGNRDDLHDRGRGFLARAGDEVASWFGSDEAARRRRGDAWHGDAGAQHHAGRGPRSYVRSDGRIEEDVNQRLTDDPRVDASDVQVTVAQGEVTLSGAVDSRAAKRRAEDLAWDVAGVRQVQNDLQSRDRLPPASSLGRAP